MKKLFYLFLVLVMCIPLVSLYTSVYAEDTDEQTRKQIVNVGGITKNDEDGVEVSKTITSGGLENYFDITLQINSKDSVKEIMRPQDLAIVVVMDVSNTMIQYNVDNNLKNDFDQYEAGKEGDTTRYATAITAATNFINEFAGYSAGLGDNVVRKIGYVAFNTDAHKVFDLSTCKTEAEANNLIADMKADTEAIVEEKGYKSKDTRYTNIEAGLAMAGDMLANAGALDNKYIIFLSDGLPTTYIKTGYTGYVPVTSSGSESKNGYFYNEVTKNACKKGTNYSDRGAIKARNKATAIKNAGVKIYSVGTGIDDDFVNTPAEMMATENKYYSDNGKYPYYGSYIDTETKNYEIGQSITDFQNWLGNSIGSGNYYNATDRASLENAYVEIFKNIKDTISTSVKASWVAEDPMGVNGNVENIEFVGLYDDNNVLHDSLTKGETNQTDTASLADNKINWDLKVSDYEEESTEGNYIYRLKYRVRLENELKSFSPSSVYDTNGVTKLSYVVRVNGEMTGEKEIAFKIPSVKGYLGQFDFVKKSSQNGKVLAGAKFELTHDPDCECLDERVHAQDEDLKYEAFSDALGKVSFMNIPSGHKYILTEVTAPIDHILSSNTKKIEIRYSVVSGIPDDYEFINEIRKANLEISKLLEGNSNDEDLFEIKVEAWFEGVPLTGTYKYKLNDSVDGEIKINEDIIKLGNNNRLVIYGLPVGAEYKVTEITTNGYQVKYQVNSNEIAAGSIAICNSGTACRLEEGNTNTVKIINYAEYELPDTGGCSMLIMVIIGTLLLVIPVIYIGYGFYQDKKFDLAS